MKTPAIPFRPNIRPALIILGLIVFASFGPALIASRTMIHFGGMVGGWVISIIATHAWWTIRSRVTGPVRWAVPLLAIAAGVLAIFLYPSPNLGLRIVLLQLLVTILWCGSAVVFHSLGWGVQRIAVIASVLLGIGLTWAIRIDGTSADLLPEVSWRWSKTEEQISEEERLKLASLKKKGLENALESGAEKAAIPAALTPEDWPQFRGVNQDSRIVGAKLNTSWDKSPPKELWRRRIGPGWGSCIVVGDKLYTQEQRGPKEAVVCLSTETGEEIWSHETVARFEEAMSGAGPRATPTYDNGFVYAFGATGQLAKLDATTGKVLWDISAPAVTDSKPPPQFWGYASSPFVMNGLVIVFLSGGPGKGMAAFHAFDGKLVWVTGDGRHGYCTAHRTTIAGVEQLLMPSDIGIESFDPKTGERLWQHLWKTRGNRSTQPILLGNDELLLPTGYGVGTQRLKITKRDARWGVEVVWESKKFRPYYNDGVDHNGLIFGFDDSRFVCLDPATGQQKWDTGSYGFGQVVLLANQGLLLVQAENGKVWLVEANGDDFSPVSSIPALSSKTWNHPVVARGKLIARNNREIVCFDLSLPK